MEEPATDGTHHQRVNLRLHGATWFGRIFPLDNQPATSKILLSGSLAPLAVFQHDLEDKMSSFAAGPSIKSETTASGLSSLV